MLVGNNNATDEKPHDGFWIGGENLVGTNGAAGDDSNTSDALADIRIRIGTLLKAENVAFLLGAGVSVDCGGPLIGTVPLEVEKALLREGIYGPKASRVRRWLATFYLAARHVGRDQNIPISRDGILARRAKIEQGHVERLPANLERVLVQLYHWRAALTESGTRLRVDADPEVDVTLNDLATCIERTSLALAQACDLPVQEKRDGLSVFTKFLNKVLTRPLNLKRVNIFTLNYDTLVEQAADAAGVVLLDGFVGTQRRVFRPDSYDRDLYFPAETTEGRVHRFDRVVHLYKLHGSITWVEDKPSQSNPYGVAAVEFHATDSGHRRLVYPTPLKYAETLGMPYAELFRRFANAIVRPQSVLFTIGYGFGDEHVNAIIIQALGIPSFTLVIVDPWPRSDFVRTLRAQKDQRVWIAEGQLGRFGNFVERLLPDLRDEDLQKRVLATQQALGRAPVIGVETGGSDGND